MPGGALKEQEHHSVRDSILAALGRPLPTPAESAPEAEAAKQPEESEAAD